MPAYKPDVWSGGHSMFEIRSIVVFVCCFTAMLQCVNGQADLAVSDSINLMAVQQQGLSLMERPCEPWKIALSEAGFAWLDSVADARVLSTCQDHREIAKKALIRIEPCVENHPLDRLSGTVYSSRKIRVQASDTTVLFYRKSLLVAQTRETTQADTARQPEIFDSIFFVEIFQRNKSWKVYRYQIIDQKPVPDGIQLSFDQRGRLTEALQCKTGQTTCRDWQAFAWWPNNHLAKAGWFSSGKSDSLHQSWYDNGQLRSQLHYQQGRLIRVDGFWDQEGKSLDIGDFSNGNGSLKVYSLSGKAVEVRQYREGRLVRKRKIKTGSAGFSEKN